MKVKSLLNQALTNSNTDSQVSELLNTCTHTQLVEVIKVLVEGYDSRQNLLQEFFNHKSDASNLECTEQELLERKFRNWVLEAKF